MKTPIKLLADYFNVGDAKRPTRDFATEIKALTPADKLELVTGVMAVTGETVSDADMDKLRTAVA